MNTLKYLWPVALIAIVSGGVNCLMLWLLRDGIAAFAEALHNNYSSSRQGGPSTLFLLNAGIMAWASIAMLERHRGAAGLKVIVMAVPFWAIAICGSFALSTLFVGPMNEATWGMLIVSIVGAFGAGGVRTWLGTCQWYI